MPRKIKDVLKGVFGSTTESGRGVNVDVASNVNTTKQESQGLSRYDKVVAKRGGNINMNTTIVVLPDIPDKNTSPEEYAKYVESFRKQFDNGEIQFVEKQASEDIIACHKITDNAQVEDILATLKGIVPEQDLLWMRTGLCVRELNENNHKSEAKRIKNNASRNSQRARNIINLTSAGFLEGYIVPICKNDDSFSIEQYNEIVECLPGFVFVNSCMTKKDIMKQVDEKIEKKERYHFEIKSISVNGLDACVDLIKEAQGFIHKKYPDFQLRLVETTYGNLRKGELMIVLG